MLARAISCSVRGISGVPVEVEADLSSGLPSVTIVGLTDRSIQEARERVRGAIRNAGYEFPARRLTVNLAPAEVPKEGTGFDLAIAVAVLRAGGMELDLRGRALLGELGLDATVRPVTGVLPMVRCLAASGVREVLVPVANAAEAALVEGIHAIPVASLQRCVDHLSGDTVLARVDVTSLGLVEALPGGVDLADIRGQESAKRALEIAAAGAHNLLMLGPPGSGKTLLASALPALLPDLAPDAALESAAIYSLRGALADRPPHSVRPPFRAPHHSISRAGLIGGGTGFAQPGELSLASNGVLFLDELCEFPRSHIEALRQPLEQRTISIARSRGAVTLPADIMLVAAANPCPCGHLGDLGAQCTCEPASLARYRGRLSGPLRDRIDLCIEVPRQAFAGIFDASRGEPSALVRDRVVAARRLQVARSGSSNASLDGDRLLDACAMDAAARHLLDRAGERLRLSARGYFRVLRVARTVADLGGQHAVGAAHIGEALGFRIDVGAAAAA